jgi:hypothetical protein
MQLTLPSLADGKFTVMQMYNVKTCTIKNTNTSVQVGPYKEEM